jgi:hypothetical protein
VPNPLYFGDNLEVLRKSIKDELVDLIGRPHAYENC